MMIALKTQVGGDYYTKLKIQPMEYSMANNMDCCQHTAIKYITRFRDKNGKEDLLKAIHVIKMLIEFEYPENHEIEGDEECKPWPVEETGLPTNVF